MTTAQEPHECETAEAPTAEGFPTGLVVSKHFRESFTGREILMLEVEKVGEAETLRLLAAFASLGWECFLAPFKPSGIFLFTRTNRIVQWISVRLTRVTIVTLGHTHGAATDVFSR